MAKSPEAFRTISEVAEWLETPTHVLRFWESKFSQLKPVKRAGGRRYYRPSDMELLAGIKQLLHEDGVTIRGVQKILREQGVKYVSNLSDRLVEPEAGPRPPKSTAPSVPAPPTRRLAPEPAPEAEPAPAGQKVVALRPGAAAPAEPKPPAARRPAPSPDETEDDSDAMTNIFANTDEDAATAARPGKNDDAQDAPSLFPDMPRQGASGAGAAPRTPTPPPKPAAPRLPGASPRFLSSLPATLAHVRSLDPGRAASRAGQLSDPVARLRALRDRMASATTSNPR